MREAVADFLALLQERLQRGSIILEKGLSKTMQVRFEAIQRGQKMFSISAEDGRPQVRLPRGEARRIAETGGGQIVQFRWQDAGKGGREQMRQMAGEGHRAIVFLRAHHL